MEQVTYVGNGPYCISNSLAMILGVNGPSPAVLQFAISFGFGMQVSRENLAFFDPYGWQPIPCVDTALRSSGWQSTLVTGKDDNDALERLTQALKNGPVFVGPVEMGYLTYHSGNRAAIGADHYLVVIGLEGGHVRVHDPHGFPNATISVSDFVEAWRTVDKIDYGGPYMMRTDFRRVEKVAEEEVIRRSIPHARRYLAAAGYKGIPSGFYANGEAAVHLADIVEKDCSEELRGHLIYFAVRAGARGLADAATCLSRVGYHASACIMAKQARLIGSLQLPLVIRDFTTAAASLRELAPTYEQLKLSLERDE